MKAQAASVAGLLLGAVLIAPVSAFAQEPPAQQPPAPAPPDGTVTVTPPPAEGEVPPPPAPNETVQPPVPIVPQPAPPPSETPPESAEGVATTPGDAKPDENGVAGWYPGFAIKSKDDKFKLRVGLQAAYRFEPYWIDGESQDRKTFFVLRPILAGNVFEKWISFWTSFEFAANPPFLLDSYIDIQPTPAFGIRVGQQYTPLSRHEYLGPQEILFPEWSPVAEYFWTGRDKGVTALGAFADRRFEYWVGAYSGTPLRQFTAIDGNYVFEARATVSPMGPPATNEAPYMSKDPVPFGISFTLQGYVSNVESATENFNPSSFRFDVEGTGVRKKHRLASADIWIQGGPFTALFEGYGRRTDPPGGDNAYTSLGGWGQMGLMVVDQFMDVGVRGNVLDANDDLDNDMFYSIEGQLGFYPVHTQNLVLKLRYGFAKQEDPEVEDAPLFTSPGDHQLVTAQLGLAF